MKLKPVEIAFIATGVGLDGVIYFFDGTNSGLKRIFLVALLPIIRYTFFVLTSRSQSRAGFIKKIDLVLLGLLIVPTLAVIFFILNILLAIVTSSPDNPPL